MKQLLQKSALDIARSVKNDSWKYNAKKILNEIKYSHKSSQLNCGLMLGNMNALSYANASIDINPPDDFTSYANQGAIDAVYVPATTKILGDVTNDRINFQAEAANVNDSLSRDIGGLVSNTAYVLRFYYHMTSQSRNGSGYAMFPSIGLSSLPYSTSEETSQDGLAFNPYQDNLARSYHISYADGNNLAGDRGAGDTRVTIFTETATAGDDYRIQSIRASATSFSSEIFSDAYTTSVESKSLTIPSTVINLRYFVIKNFLPSQNQSGNQIGWIDDLGFKNGVTSW